MKKISLLLLCCMILMMTACGNDVSITVNDDSYEEVEEGTQVDETSDPSVEETQDNETSEDESKDTSDKVSSIYTSMFPSDLEQFRVPESGDTVVTIATNYGEIHILMFPEVAPKAVENLVTHGQNNYYDGVIFHRVIENFMIQGGDPTGTGRGGESVWGSSFEDEFDDAYFPYRGTLAMANAGPGTNGSQFFIVHSSDYSEDWKNAMIDYGMDTQMADAFEALGGTPHLFNKHTVFGQVVLGMDVVDAIATVEKGAADKPVEDVVIEDVVVTIID